METGPTAGAATGISTYVHIPPIVCVYTIVGYLLLFVKKKNDNDRPRLKDKGIDVAKDDILRCDDRMTVDYDIVLQMKWKREREKRKIRAGAFLPSILIHRFVIPKLLSRSIRSFWSWIPSRVAKRPREDADLSIDVLTAYFFFLEERRKEIVAKNSLETWESAIIARRSFPLVPIQRRDLTARFNGAR